MTLEYSLSTLSYTTVSIYNMSAGGGAGRGSESSKMFWFHDKDSIGSLSPWCTVLYHMSAYLELQFPVILYSCKTNAAQTWKKCIVGIKCIYHYRLWQKKPSKPPSCFNNIYLHASSNHRILCENLQCARKCFMVIKSLLSWFNISSKGEDFFSAEWWHPSEQ